MPITLRWWRRAQKPERREGEWRKIWKMIFRLQKVLCMAQALQTDWMWTPVETYDEILNQKVTINFPPEMGVLVWLPCTGRSAESLPYILDIKNYIFLESWKTGLWNEPEKNLPGPTSNELIFLESSTFSSAAVPKLSSSLEYQKTLSVQSQLRFIPKLHNQDFTCRVFYQIMKSLFFVGCAPFVLDDVIRWFGPGTVGDTMFGFWIVQQLYCHMKKHSAKFLYKWPSYAHY